MAWAEMKKTIYSLGPLGELLLAANRRYLEFISTLEDDKAGTDKLNKISQPVEENDRNYRGFNFFDPRDEELFQSLGSGEFNISGFQNRDLRGCLPQYDARQLSHVLKRLRTHGLVKKIGRTYKYYLTRFGRIVGATVLRLREFLIIPSLAERAHA
jgi:hypothetical protein